MAFPILKRTLAPFVRSYLTSVEGIENIPNGKGFIVACNHASYFDDLAVPSVIVPVINRKVHFYVNSRFYKNYIIKLFLDHCECIPVSSVKDSSSKTLNEEGLKKALGYLAKGDPVGVFPEGSRSIDGGLQKAKTGVAYLSFKANAPVLPIGINGSEKVLRKGKFWPKREKCVLKIGKLIYPINENPDKDPSEVINQTEDKEKIEKFTRKIMQEIAVLSGKEYKW